MNFNINKVSAEDVIVDVDTEIQKTMSCGDYNGCMGISTFRLKIVSDITNYKNNIDKVSYKTYNEKTYTIPISDMKNKIGYGSIGGILSAGDTVKNLENYIINNPDYVYNILDKLNITIEKFLSETKDYYILFEPLFNVYYDDSGNWEKGNIVPIKLVNKSPEEAAYHLLLLEPSSLTFNNKFSTYNGLNGIMFDLQCAARIPFSGEILDGGISSTNEKNCSEGNHDLSETVPRTATYLRTVYNNGDYGTRFGKGAIKITDLFSNLIINKYESDENGKKTSNKLSGAKFILYEGAGCSGNIVKVGGLEVFTVNGTKTIRGLKNNAVYSLKEVEAPKEHEISNSCVAPFIEFDSKEKTISVYNKKKNKPKLKIKKVTKDSTGKLIPVGSISATFNIYGDDKCRGTSLGSLTTKKLSGISEERELDEGIYYIKETNISPSNSGYKISNECKKVDLTGQNGTVEVNYENPQTCPSELYELKLLGYRQNNLEYRKRLFELYNKYGKKGLLNFNDPYCGNPTCNRNASFMCLNAEYETQTYFDEGNISCFNTEFEYQSHKVYCLDTFQLTNPLGAPKTWNVKAGQMVINKLDRIAATGTVVRKCYFVAGNSSGYNPGKYSDYVPSLKFNGNLLTFSIPTLKQTVRGNYYSEYSASTDYLFNSVYARISDGYISSNPGNNYNLLGYGIISKFNAKTRYEIPFSITLGNMFKDHKGTREYSTNNPYRCYVNPEPEIIKDGKLNLEFRIIDTNNAFPGKSGSNNRIVGTNWRSKNLNINKKELEDNITDAKLIDSSLLRKYDLNKDGKIDESDMNFLNWYNNLANQTNKVKYSKNLYIKYIMENTNNSYNKNKAKPIYSIKLTPSTIKNIRDYNKNNKYDDFTLRCDSNGENCKLSEEFKKVVIIKGI